MPNLNPFHRGKALVPVSDLPDGNAVLIEMWLHGRPATTQAAYRSDIERLLDFVSNKPLNTVSLQDLHAFADSLADLAPASQVRILKGVKSLLSYACKTMPTYFPMNWGATLKLPKVKNTLAERILDVEQVERMLTHEEDPRNHALIRLLYDAAIRRSELCNLRWRDVRSSKTRDGTPTGQITVFGKGGITRTILLTPATWQELEPRRGDADEDTLLFDLSPSQVYVIVRKAAERAGISKPVSPHWMRHSHATHSIERGAPLQLVQATLGHANIQTTGRYLHANPSESSAQYLPPLKQGGR